MVIGFALAAMSMDQADRDGDHDVSSWKGGYPASPPQHVDYKQVSHTCAPACATITPVSQPVMLFLFCWIQDL